jgi:hypothetical protein
MSLNPAQPSARVSESPLGGGSDMELIQNLDLRGSVESIKGQRESIRAVQNALAGILAKVKEGNEAIDIEAVKAKAFPRLVEISGITLDSKEQAAMDKVKEGLSKLGGFPLPAEYWNPVVEGAKQILASQPEARAELQAQVERGKLKKEVGDPNEAFTQETARLNPTASIETQREGLTFLHSNVMGILVEIAKKNPDFKMEQLPLQNFVSVARRLADPSTDKENRLTLTVSQTIALTKLEELLNAQQNPLTNEIRSLWPSMLQGAENAREGFGARYMKRLHEKPAETIGLTLAGAAGVYLGYKAIKWLVGEAWGKAKKSASDTVDSMFSLKGIAIGLGIIGVGAYMGRHKFEAWLYEKFGLKFGNEKIDEMIAKLKKGQMPKELAEAGATIAAAQQQAGQIKEKMGEKAKATYEDVKEHGWLGLLGITTEKPETLQEHKDFSAFIQAQNENLEVDPLLFGYIKDADYETFLSQKPNILERVSFWAKLIHDKKLPPENERNQFLINHGAENFYLFLENMTKKEGRHPDFKGKTISEVMRLMVKDPAKYIDQEAVKEAQKQKGYYEKTMALLKELVKDPSKIKDRNWLAELLKTATLGGVTFVMDETSKFGVWVFHNGEDALFWENDMVYRTFKKIADECMESDDSFWKGTGMYLRVAAYTAAIGAPLGTAAGFVKGAYQGLGLTRAMLQSGIGTITGTLKGLWFPAKATGKLAKALIWNPLVHGNVPWHDVEALIDQQRFVLEDISLSRIGSDWLNMKTLPEKILRGEVEIDERLMRQLTSYKRLLHNHADHLYEKAEGSLAKTSHQMYAERYEKTKKQVDEILEHLWDGKHFDEKEWAKKVDKLVKDSKLDSAAVDILKKNKRIGVVLLDEEHPLSQFILNSANAGKSDRLLEVLDREVETLDAFTRHPGFINDAKIAQTLETLDPKNTGAFKTLVTERSAVWEALKGKELRILENQPQLVSRYVSFRERMMATEKGLGNLEGAAKETAEQGLGRNRVFQKILLNPNSERAAFLYNYTDEMTVLFEDSPQGAKALDQFLAVDERVLKIMGKGKKLHDFAELFKDFEKNEAEIVKMVTESEKKIGLFGQMARRLAQMKKGIYEKIEEKASEASTGLRNRFQNLTERFKTSPAEGGESVEVVEDSLTAAQKDLAGVEEAISKLKVEKGVGASQRQIAEQLKKAEEAEEAIKTNIQNIEELNKLKAANVGKAMTSVEEATKVEAEIQTALEAVGRSSKTAAETAEAIGVVSRLAQVLRYAGMAGAVVGTGFSIWETGANAYEAVTTDVQGRSGIAAGRAGMYGVEAAAGIGFTAGMLGVKGAAAALGEAVAVPLIPITYAGSKVFDTLYEGTLTEAEWGQKYSYAELIHQWFSTGGSVSIGDAWVAGFHIEPEIPEHIEKNLAKKQETMHKIFRVLAAAGKNPALMQLIATEPPSKEKDKKIEEMIKGSYSKYHEVYFRNQPTTISSYENAEKFIADAQLFDDLMRGREDAKKNGRESLKLGPVDLMNPRYEIAGDADNPQPKSVFAPWQLVEYYKQDLLNSIKEMPQIASNLEAVEPSYLFRLYVQMKRILDDEQSRQQLGGMPGSAEVLKSHMALIRNFLECKQGINFNVAVLNPRLFEPKMELDEIVRRLEDLGSENLAEYRAFEQEKFDKSPAVYAMTKLGRYFGYSGDLTEEGIKEFFSEAKASYQGIYWDGSNWFVQERGMERDDKVGPSLNKESIEKMVALLLENPDDIVEHRHDSVFADSYDFSGQVATMASVLKNGYEEGEKKWGPQKSPAPVRSPALAMAATGSDSHEVASEGQEN